MNNSHLAACLVLSAVVLPLLPACRRAEAERPAVTAPRVFTITGVVRTPLHDGQVVIEHEDVPGLMPGMTMPFIVGNETEAARLQTGDRVRFHFLIGDESRAQDFEIIGRETTSSAIASAPRSRVRRLKIGDQVPAFHLIDQDGHGFSEADLAGRFTVVTFIFTRCPVPEFCPATTSKFKALQGAIATDAKLQDQANLLTVTLDPEFDRPEILRAYGEAVGADFARWHFLTGETQAAGDFARAFSVFAERKAGTLDHTLCTTLIDPRGHIVDLWRGNGWQPADVLGSLRGEVSSASQ